MKIKLLWLFLFLFSFPTFAEEFSTSKLWIPQQQGLTTPSQKLVIPSSRIVPSAFELKSKGRFPIVFVHGLGVKGQMYEWFVPLQKMLKKSGYEVLIAHLPFGGTIEEGAEALRKEIERLVPHGPYHLVGHSRGGLIARFALAMFGLSELDPETLENRCVSLTTLGTPHYGSPIAEVALNYLRKPNKNLFDKAAHKLAEHFAYLSGLNQDSIEQLTPQYMKEVFNAQVQDVPNFPYYSMGFAIRRAGVPLTGVPAFWITEPMIREMEGHLAPNGGNDGMVSIYSAGWGKSINDNATYFADHYSCTSGINSVCGGASTCSILLKVTDNLKRNFEEEIYSD
ncbi:MAG: esterase/lipase family protein [Bacteriovoracia bacterium]